MRNFVFRRLIFLILTFLLTSIIVFTITQFLPGDIARIILGREASEVQLSSLREELGLNDPLPVQYFRWLTNFITGDWGNSFSTNVDIRPLILGRMRNSFMLAFITFIFAVPLSIAMGVYTGLREGKTADNMISASSLSLVGLPEFITGLVLIEIFAFKLGWFPANSSIRSDDTFIEALPMLILPALTASLVLLAYISRLTRAGVIEELKQDYVRTAVLKGLGRRTVVTKHVLRNALLPTITIVAISFGWLIGGLIVIENVFNYPGLGRLIFFAIDRRDIPLLQSITLIIVLVFALSNFAADLLYGFLNPRIHFQ